MRARKADYENLWTVRPEELERVTDVYGDVVYIPASREPGRLIRCYHKDGRRMVEKRTGEREYHQVMLHPDNIASPAPIERLPAIDRKNVTQPALL